MLQTQGQILSQAQHHPTPTTVHWDTQAPAQDGWEKQGMAPQLGCAQRTSSSACRSLSLAIGRVRPGWCWHGEGRGAGPPCPVQPSRGAGPALHPRNLQLVHWVTPGASSSTWTNMGEGKATTAASKKPHLFKNKKLRGNEKTKALLSLVLSSRGNETSKAPIQRRVGGREIPLQTHLSEQLLKWKCRSSETFKFPPTAREEEGGRRTSRDSSAMQIQTGGPFRAAPRRPCREGICQGVNQDRHTVLISGSQLEGSSGLEGRGGKGMNEDSSI